VIELAGEDLCWYVCGIVFAGTGVCFFGGYVLALECGLLVVAGLHYGENLGEEFMKRSRIFLYYIYLFC
jgi:hypothetical protein